VTLPPLASLRVRVLDAEGDAPVPDATVVVRYADPREGPSTRDETSATDPERDDVPEWPQGYMRLERAPGSEDFVGRVASGAVWIDALAQGRVGSSARRTLAPGDGETLVELRLPRAGRVSVRVLRGSALAKDATGSILCAAQASVADEDWSARSVVLQAGVALFDRVRPGPYAISWSSGHGEPAVAREIVVRAGETATVDLPTK
jgi:hypothetical protein